MLNEKDLQNIKNLSDDKLKELVTVITDAVGGDGAKAALLKSNTVALKQTLAGLSPEQAENFLKLAGQDNAERIYRIISGR